jgi:cellulose biosynthesis protein BcsQ
LSPTRPFQVLTVASNKGGVGKTTIATNLAVYFRALREDLPILLLGFDEQRMSERMFALEGEAHGETVLSAMRNQSFASAARYGEYGVRYVPSSPDVAELKREIDDPHHLERALLASGCEGLVIVDTKSDIEILTQNAIAASDLTIVVVEDAASLVEAERIFRLLEEWKRPPENARIALSQVDLRIKFAGDEEFDILALLLSEIRKSGRPLFEAFISRSPKIQALTSNPQRRALSILHHAAGSLIHLQMRHLAEEVLAALDELGYRDAVEPLAAQSPFVEAPFVAASATAAPTASEPPLAEDAGRRLLSIEELLDPSTVNVFAADSEAPRQRDRDRSLPEAPSPGDPPEQELPGDHLLSVDELLDEAGLSRPAHEARPARRLRDAG